MLSICRAYDLYGTTSIQNALNYKYNDVSKLKQMTKLVLQSYITTFNSFTSLQTSKIATSIGTKKLMKFS